MQKYHNGMYLPRKFYKEGGFNPHYDRDVERYDEWRRQCHALIRKSTSAANWFADVVRRDINPIFCEQRKVSN
jgi:hypothetical protein